MEAAAQTSVAALKNPPPRELAMPDLKIDMFSLRGFELAQRIAKAFATSDAVPSIFRSHNLKKDKNGEVWVENPSAFGNCLVAIETAQAVGMSITAVMQNANVIEGKLSWSGKFIIAAVNASRRFIPLRFAVTNKGNIKASYKEKDGWNKEKNKWNMIEHTVELENLECIAWALPKGTSEPTPTPEQLRTYKGRLLDLYRDMGLPVIESAPVSMRMAVEEGWYAKPGSKWQTEMKHLMLQYRAGAYFGNIHAPDIVMGMGKSTEEIQDVVDVQRQADGTYAANLDELRGNGAAPAEKPDTNAETVVVTSMSEKAPDATMARPVAMPVTDISMPDEDGVITVTYAQVADAMTKAKTVDVLNEAADLIKSVTAADQRDELSAMYEQRKEQIENPPKPRARQQQAPINME